jgi:RHS repeat-associated protein
MARRQLPFGHRYQHGRARRSAAACEETGAGFHQLFHGMAFDAAAGLCDLASRAYSPTLARWAEQEPLAYVGRLNVYAVPPDHPVVRVDPLGA